jgi:hypothetical protein
MSDTAVPTDAPSTSTAPSAAPPAMGLVARLVGVVFAPKETFAAVAARPKWLGMLLITTILMAVVAGGFYATPVGQQAYLDQASKPNPLTGAVPGEQQMKYIEAFARYMPYLSGGAVLIGGPIVTLVMSGIAFLVFGTFMGGQAKFKQVFAVVTHSGVIGLVSQLIVMPVNYFRETLESPMNLAVLLPMLDPGGFLAKLLGQVELFRVWSIFVLSIGLAVVYKRKTQSVAIPLFVIYAVIAIAMAAFAAARS